MMWALSHAIFPMVFPSTWVWSSPMWVMTATSGSTTIVASSRPPMPTSTSAISTSSSQNARKARAVMSSKTVRNWFPRQLRSASGMSCWA